MNRNFILISLLVSFFLNGYGTALRPSSRLQLAIYDLKPEATENLKNSGIMFVEVIEDIHPVSPVKVDEQTLARAVRKAYPDNLTTGYGLLDWEWEGYYYLAHEPSESFLHREITREFLKSLTVAKELRPNVKWGYYEIPFMLVRFNRKEELYRSLEKNKLIIQAVDVFYPSMYTYNPTDMGNITDVPPVLKQSETRSIL